MNNPSSTRHMTGWTLTGIMMIYESEEPVLRETVLFEAGRHIAPAVAIHKRNNDRERLSPNRNMRPGVTSDIDYQIDMGRRRMVLENLNELRRKGRIAQFEKDGKVYYRVGPRPYDLADLTEKREKEGH